MSKHYDILGIVFIVCMFLATISAIYLTARKDTFNRDICKKLCQPHAVEAYAEGQCSCNLMVEVKEVK